ncbi:MAG: hypothetical protein IPP61_16835 [Cytophagaceae bacterium]|nr:hypothetical protein [Cytophagaceae bacterium]MBL0303996.1 hypothetical protein [Cytophagaceae bacterium]MBL0326809.1 hypothetical protein [Cytophagaceae bacterium]
MLRLLENIAIIIIFGIAIQYIISKLWGKKGDENKSCSTCSSGSCNTCPTANNSN